MPSAALRPTRWTRAQSLMWIMTRRLSASAEAPPYTPSRRSRSGTGPMRWVIDDTLRRMQAAPSTRRLPRFADAEAALAQAEQGGLTPDSDGRFLRDEIQKLWPSPYGRAASHSKSTAGGVAPRPWNELTVQKLAGKFMRKRRDMTRDDLRTWAGNVSFSDPERWTAYVRRAMAAAVIDILLRRQFSLTRDEGAAMLANVWSWRADGPLPPRG